ncbi:hypothetical protein DFH29DRAFT_876683 [Suillus ampliporus]|nr:hypothetical protein DFH29DRAFT_876683 [Suillus ampliporus]
MREVELWENERQVPGPSSSSSFGKPRTGSGLGFDVGTTRVMNGWSGVHGEVSNLAFSLAPGWAFVQTKGWRPDALGNWVCAGSVSDSVGLSMGRTTRAGCTRTTSGLICAGCLLRHGNIRHDETEVGAEGVFEPALVESAWGVGVSLFLGDGIKDIDRCTT